MACSCMLFRGTVREGSFIGSDFDSRMVIMSVYIDFVQSSVSFPSDPSSLTLGNPNEILFFLPPDPPDSVLARLAPPLNPAWAGAL